MTFLRQVRNKFASGYIFERQPDTIFEGGLMSKVADAVVSPGQRAFALEHIRNKKMARSAFG